MWWGVTFLNNLEQKEKEVDNGEELVLLGHTCGHTQCKWALENCLS